MAEPGDAKSKKILVIEDNPQNMEMVAMMLARAEYKVLKAEDAQNGISLARQLQPDLILMDIQLPDMDGLDATRILREDADTSDIKIVALTAYAMKGDREKMLAGGCDDYISKPFRYREFMAKVEKILAKAKPDSSIIE